MNLSETPGQLFRIDPLSGCSNLLAFVEWLSKDFNRSLPLSLAMLDVNFTARINESMGREYGDALLRWLSIFLTEETRSKVYRVGGDEFLTVLRSGNQEEREALVHQVFDRLNSEAGQLGVQAPLASIAVIHYPDGLQIEPPRVWLQVSDALFQVKTVFQRTFHTFSSAEMEVSDIHLNWSIKAMMDRIVTLGIALNETHHTALTDPVTGLPNMITAQKALEATLHEAGRNEQPFAILLIDGDDLKNYNKISYQAGDEMIRNLGAALQTRLRPGDLLARWRMGDEFLVILPGATSERAMQVGQRLCASAREASQSWLLPVTVSIGIAVFSPADLEVDSLIKRVEEALQKAKDSGKNQVVLGEPT